MESHLRALEITHAITVVRPFHGGGQSEIVRQPKVHTFDTGFLSFARGWDPLRQEDPGQLREQLMLEHLQAHFPYTPACYWRDKQGREVNFVPARGPDAVDAVECKWDANPFDSSALNLFRTYYAQGRNYQVTPSAGTAYTKHYGNLEVEICSPSELSN